jgi:tetratricopeptide (TPR) repeat protein
MEYEEYLEQGETLASEGLIEEALSRFEQALEAAPENPEVIEAVGRALLNLDRLEEAEASFLDALEIDPEWVAPRMGLALVALRRDEPFKIVHHLERAIEADPGYPGCLRRAGTLLRLHGRAGPGEGHLRALDEPPPEDADMLINAGLTLFDAADFAEAYAFFEKAVEAAPEEDAASGALTFRANALDMLGRYDEAVAAYEEVIPRRPSGGRPTPTSGICHARNGRPGEGRGRLQAGPRGLPRLAGDTGRARRPPPRPAEEPRRGALAL